MSQKPTSDADPKQPALLRSFGRRRGKPLRPQRMEVMDEVMDWARISVDADPASLFPTSKQLWLEIGFGNGEHLLRLAQENLDIGLIGCEPYINGVSALCRDIKETGMRNIRIWPDDARVFMARLTDASIDRLFLLHPDPWPKARHHKRRFLQTETLDEVARLLKPGAEFHMATDHEELAIWIEEKTAAHSAFTLLSKEAKAQPETRYGQKGVRQGRPSLTFIYTRKI